MELIKQVNALPARPDSNSTRPQSTPQGAGTVSVPAATVSAPAPPPSTPPPAAPPPVNRGKESRAELQAMLERVASRIETESRSLTFRVNESIDGVVVSVIDRETEQLIRQIPGETLVRLSEVLGELEGSAGAPGLLLSEQA